MSTPALVTVALVGLFAFLALVTLLRVLLAKDRVRWRRLRVGVFVERDPQDP